MTRKLDPRKIIYYTMMWSKAFVPVIFLFSALASAVRTFMTTRAIYTAGGTDPNVAAAVAAFLTIGVEGAIFILALAQEWQEIKWRQARRKRHVLSVKSVAHWIKERIGTEEPASYDQLPERRDLIKVALFIAFCYALVSNFNIGIKDLMAKVGNTTTIQAFISGLVNAPADIQISFFVDMASILFPPFMALAGGLLTARFASEIVNAMTRKENKLERQERNTVETVKSPSKKRVTNASRRVSEWLNEHPEDVTLPQAALAKRIGVSVGTVNAVIQEMKPEIEIMTSQDIHCRLELQYKRMKQKTAERG